MTRDEILSRAEKHGALTAGWIFSAQGLEKFWREAFEAGRKSVEQIEILVETEREACAEMVEGMNVQHPKHIAAAIRARGEK